MRVLQPKRLSELSGFFSRSTCNGPVANCFHTGPGLVVTNVLFQFCQDPALKKDSLTLDSSPHCCLCFRPQRHDVVKLTVPQRMHLCQEPGAATLGSRELEVVLY